MLIPGLRETAQMPENTELVQVKPREALQRGYWSPEHQARANQRNNHLRSRGAVVVRLALAWVSASEHERGKLLTALARAARQLRAEGAKPPTRHRLQEDTELVLERCRHQPHFSNYHKTTHGESSGE